MPDYGISSDAEGMLDWSWALERMAESRDFWLATVLPDGRPHVTPVWGVWIKDSLWFSCALGSRKARNLALNPACVAATADTRRPVIIDGRAELIRQRDLVVAFRDALKEKHRSEWQDDVYTVDFFDANAGGGGTYRVVPASVFGLAEDEFTTSPTRWLFR